MKIAEARKICQDFANEHKVIFQDEGEVGFGRECVGFLHGDNYIDYCPYKMVYKFGEINPDYEKIDELDCKAVRPPKDVEAYHKHDCLAVLGRGNKAIIGLATWVKSMQDQGKVEIVDYQTGAQGINAILHGIVKKAVVVR